MIPGVVDHVPFELPSSFSHGRYKKLKDIGHGAYSHVMLVFDEVSGEKRVIKRVYDTDATSCNEVDILKKVMDHPNIVRFFDSFTEKEGDTNVLHIVMEFCEGGDLAQFLKNRKKPHWIANETLENWLRQLLRGVDHLHELNVLHRDLKTANVFVTADNTLKIADFGISRSLTRTQCATTMVGTPFYMAPEVVNLDVVDGYNAKSDVWSLGVIMYELCGLSLPFPGANVLAVANGIMCNKPASLPVHVPKRVRDITMQMMQTDAVRRPSVRELLIKWTESTAHDPPPAVKSPPLALSPCPLPASNARRHPTSPRIVVRNKVRPGGQARAAAAAAANNNGTGGSHGNHSSNHHAAAAAGGGVPACANGGSAAPPGNGAAASKKGSGPPRGKSSGGGNSNSNSNNNNSNPAPEKDDGGALLLLSPLKDIKENPHLSPSQLPQSRLSSGNHVPAAKRDGGAMNSARDNPSPLAAANPNAAGKKPASKQQPPHAAKPRKGPPQSVGSNARQAAREKDGAAAVGGKDRDAPAGSVLAVPGRNAGWRSKSAEEGCKPTKLVREHLVARFNRTAHANQAARPFGLVPPAAVAAGGPGANAFACGNKPAPRSRLRSVSERTPDLLSQSAIQNGTRMNRLNMLLMQ
eukprot:gene16861-25855_t